MDKATSDAINRIYDKLEPISESVTRIETQLSLLPPQPKRPCEFLDKHIEDHNENKRTWYSSLVGSGVDMLKMAAVAVITYFFMKRQ
ncbi:MAG TPA: hypothetical protein PLP05_00370 [Sedimentisphaerales bacterium]|nr:hypothetical protein [Sedimentisphaerales bacterium]